MSRREVLFPILLIASSLVPNPLLAGSAPGIRNFDRVNSHVLRGGQPTDAGFAYLAHLGVATVIDLRAPGDRSRNEAHIVAKDGMRYINVPMSGLTPPTTAEIAKILSLLEDESAGPVFVHCRRGADRTGAVIAAYHIDHDRWDNSRALRDAKAHGMSFIQIPREFYIEDFHPRAAKRPAPSLADGGSGPASPAESSANR